VDEIYDLPSLASPVLEPFDPVPTTRTGVVGTVNMPGLAKPRKANVLQANTSDACDDPSV
jgi:hypothetical protein